MKENDVSVPRRSLLSRVLFAIESIGNALPHPATLFAIFAATLVLLSWLMSKLGVVAVNPIDSVEVRPINLISRDGLHWILENTIANFTGFAPLGTVLVAMLGIGVAEIAPYEAECQFLKELVGSVRIAQCTEQVAVGRSLVSLDER